MTRVVILDPEARAEYVASSGAAGKHVADAGAATQESRSVRKPSSRRAVPARRKDLRPW